MIRVRDRLPIGPPADTLGHVGPGQAHVLEQAVVDVVQPLQRRVIGPPVGDPEEVPSPESHLCLRTLVTEGKWRLPVMS